MVKLSLPTNVVFSVHVHICDAAYISSITSNSFLNLDSRAWFHFWGHLHFWGLLPPFCHFHFLVCPPLLVCLHLLSLLFLGCFYFLGCLIKSPIFAVQKAIAPKNGVEFRQGSNGSIRSSLATSCDVSRRRARSPNFDQSEALKLSQTDTHTDR